MIPRATAIAVLIGVEVAIVAGIAGAVRGGSPAGGMPAGAPAWSFAAGPDPALAVDIGQADLTIETRPGAQITVTVVPGMQIVSSGPIAARDDGGTIHITAAQSDRASFFSVDDRNVHVIVPPATRVIVASAGDIVASGLRATASFASAHGGITVRDFRGQLTATSSDGHVDISDADCPALQASSANGRIVLHRVTALRLRASSSNGRVEARALVVRDGSVSSSNGRVSLGFAPGADTTVSAASSNGHVHVSGFAASPGNSASADDGDEDGDGSASTLVRIGAGSGRLDVHASNGSIDLSQEG